VRRSASVAAHQAGGVWNCATTPAGPPANEAGEPRDKAAARAAEFRVALADCLGVAPSTGLEGNGQCRCEVTQRVPTLGTLIAHGFDRRCARHSPAPSAPLLAMSFPALWALAIAPPNLAQREPPRLARTPGAAVALASLTRSADCEALLCHHRGPWLTNSTGSPTDPRPPAAPKGHWGPFSHRSGIREGRAASWPKPLRK